MSAGRYDMREYLLAQPFPDERGIKVEADVHV